MKKTLVIIFTLPLVLLGFSEKKVSVSIKENPLQYLSDSNSDAEGAYFTTDHQGKPVLCWTEKEASGNLMVFRRWESEKNQFGKAVKIEASRGLSPHSENMPKIAFRKDGSMVAVFSNSRRVNRPDAMFEGEIYYIQSFDGGASWTPRSYVHSDTSSGYSRGFIDITTLSDGEIGAVWLDGRKKDKSGSTLYFSKTQGKKGFVKDQPISEKVCQCCRTDITTDASGNTHIVYRDIEIGLAGNELRDMHHLVSSDQGKTFSKPQCIGADNWNINACPHTGPSVATSNQKLEFFWFTGAGKSGIYHTTSADKGKSFSEKVLITETGKHPQALALTSRKTLLLYDETLDNGEAFTARVIYKILEGVSDSKEVVLNKQDVEARYPVAARLTDDQWIAAWMQKSKDGKWKIVSQKIN